MDLIRKLLYGKTYGICAFCKSKLHQRDAVFYHENVCICPECNSKIKIAPFDFSYKGTKNISYVISPMYYSGPVRDAILNMKFYSDRGTAFALGYYINHYLSTFPNLFLDFDFIVPVPLSKANYQKRGYNQAELIANEISKFYNIPVNAKALFKIKDTPPQSTLSHEERVNNVKDAYMADPLVLNKRILLIDDVFTTGSTLESCAKTLKSAGAFSISAVTAAYGSRPKHSSEYYDLFR